MTPRVASSHPSAADRNTPVSVPPSQATPVSANLSPDLVKISNVLENLIQATTQNSSLKPNETKRLMEVEKRIIKLKSKLPNMAPASKQNLQELCNAIEQHNIAGALKAHMNLVKTSWTANSDWLPSVKTLLLLAKKYN